MALTAELKQSILMTAISGGLTEQLKTDTPVDNLLLEMEKEKEQYGGKRKARRGINLSDISDNEIPCEIPSTWRYVRLIDIVKSISAGGDKPKNFTKEKTEKNTIEVISNGETNRGIFGYTDKAVVEETSLTISGRGTIGYSVIRTEPYVPIVRLLVVLPLSMTNLEYIKVVLAALIEFGSGTAVKQLTVPMISPKVIPLPPIEEQQRIVDRVNVLMGKLDEFSEIEQQLIALKSNFPAAMRGAILQAAMQGKLTEQLESDSLVDTFLHDLDSNRAVLVNAKAIPYDNKTTSIDEVEIPFDIPDSWEWSKIGMLFSVGTGMTPLKSNTDYYKNGNIPWVTSGLTSQTFVFSADEHITECALKETNLKIYPPHTLIVAMYGQGKTRGQVSELMISATVNQACAVLGNIIDSMTFIKYVKYFFKFNYDYIRQKAGGSAQPNLNLDKIKNTYIPIPPIEEQQRIVERLDALLPICDTLVE